MDKILLFIIFILFGIFIYYILKKQCKCDIVEGQQLAAERIEEFGINRDPDSIDQATINYLTWAWDDGGPCNPVRLIGAAMGLHEPSLPFTSGSSITNAREALVGTYSGFLRTNQCIEDIKNIMDQEDCNKNPYACIIEAGGEEGSFPINNDWLGYALFQVLRPLNNYLKYNSNKNICSYSQEDEPAPTPDVMGARQMLEAAGLFESALGGLIGRQTPEEVHSAHKECINAISGLALIQNIGSAGPVFNDQNLAWTVEYFNQCNKHNDCIDSFKDEEWWTQAQTNAARQARYLETQTGLATTRAITTSQQLGSSLVVPGRH